MGFKYITEVSAAEPDASPAKGPTYRSTLAKDGFAPTGGITSLYDSFQKSVKGKFADNPCLGWRPTVDGKAGDYKWLTYAEVEERSAAIGSALMAVGLTAKNRVGVFSVNSPEWMITLQACNRQSLQCVPLYDTLGETAIEYIIGHSEASAVCVAAANWPQLLSALPKWKEQVKALVYWGGPVNTKAAEELGIKAYSFDEFLAMGRSKPADAIPPTLDDLCTIMYTSGTTGMPKGVEISHRAVVSCVAAQAKYIASFKGSLVPLNPDDVQLSYLPLAHIMDRAAEEMMLTVGARVGYYQGDVKKLVDDIAVLKPTIFLGVPRVFDRIYSGALAKIKAAGGLKARLFHWGFSRKLYYLNKGYAYNKAAPFFDRLVFSKIKEALGGRVRLIVTGGAPLARHVEDFLRVTMCAPVVQGYGLTETCAATFIAVPDVPGLVGTCGPPLPSHDFRLEAISEMNYDPLATPPRGEICVRGPILFSGYYKDPKQTAEVLDAEGWFHTGDVGTINELGGVQIIDRKKNIFKLSQGEYVAIEKVEAVYKKLETISQIWAYGNSLENVLVAVVVLDETALPWAQKNGLPRDPKALVADKKAAELMQKEMDATAKAGGLKGFEMVRKIVLESEQFSVEQDTMTPTFKLKRPQLQKKYQAQIDKMYEEVKASGR